MPYISKLLERDVTEHLVIHLNENHLLDKFQSAYHAGFSTETALLQVMNDLLCSVNIGKVILLTLLDLSAAFDTTDHVLLMQDLSLKIASKNRRLPGSSPI